MTTAVDTSVLLDLLGGDPTFGSGSKAAFDRVCFARLDVLDPTARS